MPDVLSSRRYEPEFIDLVNKNTSHGWIISLVGNDKTVLEIGTSTGYISKILKENGNVVTGVEIDREAGDLAKQFCESMLIGDIEEMDLSRDLKDSYFDAIVLGDILEHLKDPELVLEKIKKFLKPEGYLVISIPNGCHGDIIINLLYGDFRYTSMGLHDETHLRFFGLKNILDIFNGHGYIVTNIGRVRTPVGLTELKVDQDKVPGELLSFIKSIPDSDVYQYVFTAVPGNAGDHISSAEPINAPDLVPLFSTAIEDTVYNRAGILKQEMAKINASYLGSLNQIESLGQQILNKDDKIKQMGSQIHSLDRQLEDINKSTVWRLVMAYNRLFVERLLPAGSRRRKAYQRFLNSLRKL